MKKLLSLFLLSSTVVGAACSSAGDFKHKQVSTHYMQFKISDNLGSRTARLPFSPESAVTNRVGLVVWQADGKNVDYNFNGWVRLSVKPGTIDKITGGDTEVQGRNVKIVNGRAEGLDITYRGAFGDATLMATDLGYEILPGGVGRDFACSDGLDNDGNGLVDYPADPGCEAADDNSETGGEYSMWASPVIYYAYPRISDVRGRERSGASTPLKFQQVQLDTGYHPDTKAYDFKLIVTRIATSGFYVTDIDDARGFSSLFFYNFSPPPGMRVCDRVRAIAGTATEFYGSVQMSFPSWQLEEWQPKTFADGSLNPRGWDCEVPEATWLLPNDITTAKTMLSRVHSLVRVETGTRVDADGKSHAMEAIVTPAFGPEFPKLNDRYNPTSRTYPGNSKYLITKNATNCDFNNDGNIDFSNAEEAACSDSCDNFPLFRSSDGLSCEDQPTAPRDQCAPATGSTACTEYSNYVSRSTFRVVTVDSVAGGYSVGTVQADLSTSPHLDPFAMRGKPFKALRGTLNYFSGGSQFTIQARCSDDFAEAGGTIKPVTEACIFPRSQQELEAAN